MVEMALKIGPDGGVDIFIQGQAGGGVVDEDMGQAEVDLADFRGVGFNQTGDEVKATLEGRQTKGRLEPGHS